MFNDETYYIYIITNKKDGILYIGMTGNIKQRITQYKKKHTRGFANKYGLDILIYYEKFKSATEAIKREKQIKKWNRQWKINLINDLNPDWNDLSHFFI
ncbi:GIY-YIG nuclease family protein [Jejuia pallidilutea]|jgi:putative endonuclease|uniref:Excinuclease ABC C subunit-like n=1 Tax=Jejuia pallidilutea TaxID=504487 RepID=A0A090VNB5_9FLAO|nr:GIY-YIG nuclease family protein [Jejuia pallidilutea]GAL66211.1 excinuclease ABC, C subunit-like [Jejuia pallidilutea]GAL71175.1 excinuclease ABC C subunit-like [Jejuia pallidilutea]GAL88236.1 excinuclease ABC C subunit-like [Jejuia pallidilutea]